MAVTVSAPGQSPVVDLCTLDRGNTNQKLTVAVTGTGWAFEIRQASAEVILPEAVSNFSLTGYTGPQGVRSKNWNSENPALIELFSKPLNHLHATRV